MAQSKISNPNQTRLRYLPCRVEPGMFKDEWLVFLNALNPENPSNVVKVQLLVDSRDVQGVQGKPQRNNPTGGWLRVILGGSEGKFVKIILPQPAQPFGE